MKNSSQIRRSTGRLMIFALFAAVLSCRMLLSSCDRESNDAPDSEIHTEEASEALSTEEHESREESASGESEEMPPESTEESQEKSASSESEEAPPENTEKAQEVVTPSEPKVTRHEDNRESQEKPPQREPETTPIPEDTEPVTPVKPPLHPKPVFDELGYKSLKIVNQTEFKRIYVDACNASCTPIVIFPAHNESYGSKAHSRYPDVAFMDWRKEVNAFISSGVNKWNLCYNDQHLHSTPLAGYIGAHMIFRGIYGENPPAQIYKNSFGRSNSAQFGFYYANGYLQILDESLIMRQR